MIILKDKFHEGQVRMVGEVRQKEISIENLRVDLGKQSVCDSLGCCVRLSEL